MVRLKTSHTVDTRDPETLVRVGVTNPTAQIAFFIQLALTKGSGGQEILPVFWSDNYFSLLPGQTRELTATFPAQAAAGRKPVLEIGGWNIETDFTCKDLSLSSRKVKPGAACTVTATVADTFLDGSRVPLLVDGKPLQTKWAWARARAEQVLTFDLKLTRPGVYRVSVGQRIASLAVQP